ncbi:MAG TPA: transglutaminase family protein, partial [Oceanipulchritudo sp.]|nr:transglutaminase family protein [Oceanipulchritudo sp.]
MPLYSIKHSTRYRYLYPVLVSHHAIYLQPLNLPSQKCREFTLTTDPACTDYRTRVDYFGNISGLFSVQEEHQSLLITSQSIVEAYGKAPDLNALPMTCGQATQLFKSGKSIPLEALQHLFGSNRIQRDPPDALREYAQSVFQPDKPLLQGCLDLMDDLKRNFTFDAEATDVDTSVEDFMKLRRGVCQDFAHFSITVLTAMGLPAKYVSGYILSIPPPGKPRLEGADASHAWVSVYLPQHGWVDFDPTNNIFCSDQHVTLAYGRDFDDVSL